MTTYPDEDANPDWEEIYLCLYAFTDDLLQKRKWCRGKKPSTFVSGKTVEDYVGEAICRYLEHPEKFEQTNGTLIDYLKLNLVRSMVSNDVRSAENRKTSNIIAVTEDKIEDDNSRISYLDSIMPFAEALFDDQIDYENIMKKIEAEISGDTILENIFLGSRIYGMKRGEVMKEFLMSASEYDNGKRRLTSILNRIAKEYNLN